MILLGIHKPTCKSSFKTTIIQKYTFVNDLQQGKSLNIIKRRCIKIPPPQKKKSCMPSKKGRTFFQLVSSWMDRYKLYHRLTGQHAYIATPNLSTIILGRLKLYQTYNNRGENWIIRLISYGYTHTLLNTKGPKLDDWGQLFNHSKHTSGDNIQCK